MFDPPQHFIINAPLVSKPNSCLSFHAQALSYHGAVTVDQLGTHSIVSGILFVQARAPVCLAPTAVVVYDNEIGQILPPSFFEMCQRGACDDSPCLLFLRLVILCTG